MKQKMITLVGMALLLFLPATVKAQYMTEFFLTDVHNNALKEAAQENISNLLTACNVAFTNDTDSVSFIDVKITPATRKIIEDMWAYTPFRCAETDIVERCLNTYDKNFQVRNIPVFMKNDNGGEDYQELVIKFNKSGCIIDLSVSIGNNNYIKVIKYGSDVTDYRYREMMLDYLEQFRTAYNTKDIPFLQQVYSDDALIITGKVIKAAPSEANNFLPTDKVSYVQQTKKQYLGNLSRVFKNNKRILVTFDDIKVVKHPAKAGFYGVLLKQGWKSDSYSDEGYLFLLWDFTKPDTPQIHVRTWQPTMINPNTPLPEEEIFTITDFNI